MAVADYVFVETGPDGGLRYEVRCRKCGECYSEDSREMAEALAVTVELLEWPPDREPVPEVDWRERARDTAAVVVARTRTEAERMRDGLARARAQLASSRAELPDLVQRVRPTAPPQWLGRMQLKRSGQTGG